MSTTGPRGTDQPDRTAEISVIIVNLNTCGLLDACLASLERERASVSLQVIVIDNGSSDGSVAMMQEKYPATVLLRNVQPHEHTEEGEPAEHARPSRLPETVADD